MSTSKSASAEWRNYGFVPLAGALGYATSVLHVYSLGPFIQPLQQEFGWSRAQVSAGLTMQGLLAGLCCLPVGLVVDRLGPRRVGLIGVLLMCASVALLGTATGQMANWLFLWSVIAVGVLGVQPQVWNSAVASRFEKSRGLAFAVTLSGASLAATVYPLLATWLISNYGWRTAYMGMSGLWAVLVFPIVLVAFRGAQDQNDRAGAAPVAASAPGATLAEGLRSPALYKLLLAAAFFAFTVIGVVVHFVPILKDSGATPLGAAGTASLIGIFSIVGRLGTGFLLDRYPAQWVGAGAFMLPVVGSTLLLSDGANPLNQSLAAAAFGLTVGSEVDVVAYLASRHFGLRSFGALYGTLVMALTIGAAFGPLTSGAIFDRYQSYAPFLVLTIVMTAIAALALIRLGPAPRLAVLAPDQAH